VTTPSAPALGELALSRSTLDRDAERRADPALLDTLLADAGTRVLVLDGDRGLVIGGEAAPGGADDLPRLLLLPPDAARAAVEVLTGAGQDVTAAYLGTDTVSEPPVSEPPVREPPGARVEHVLLAVPRPPTPLTGPPTTPAEQRPAPAGARWAGLREVGTLLDGTGAGLLTAAVALSNWHSTHPRCARCGEPTGLSMSGWARRCPACGAEHYPRTDPAVIMAVVDADDRILLGRQAVWPPKRYSTLAGFVEPGESLEAAVRREVLEESGIVVGEVTYQGSQPWPFPSSLMLGFSARATSTAVEVDGEEIAHARWWSRAEFEADLAAGALLLPPTVSIARRLIEQWYGGPITDAGEAWR
jgi:NAD+ diphosphatase